MKTKTHKISLRTGDEVYNRLNAIKACTGRTTASIFEELVLKGSVSLESKGTIVRKLAVIHDNFNQQTLMINKQLEDIKLATDRLDFTCRRKLENGNAALDSLLRDQSDALRQITTYYADVRKNAESEVASLVNSEIGQ